MLTNQATKSDLITRFGHLTVHKIAEESFPSIGQLERQYGEKSIVEAIATILEDLNRAFGNDLDKSMMLDVITNLVNGENRNITLEGFYITCQEIKCTTAYKLTVNKVLSAVKKHLNDHLSAVQLKNFNNHLRHKEGRSDVKSSPWDDPVYKKFKAEQYAKEIIKKGK